MILTKEYAHELRVLFKFKAAPKHIIHAFGDSIHNYRNGIYSTKEWDFVDSNLDKFLLYDYKGTTSYWGENKTEDWYSVY